MLRLSMPRTLTLHVALVDAQDLLIMTFGPSVPIILDKLFAIHN